MYSPKTTTLFHIYVSYGKLYGYELETSAPSWCIARDVVRKLREDYFSGTGLGRSDGRCTKQHRTKIIRERIYLTGENHV